MEYRSTRSQNHHVRKICREISRFPNFEIWGGSQMYKIFIKFSDFVIFIKSWERAFIITQQLLLTPRELVKIALYFLGHIWGGRRQSWNFLQINNLQILENVEHSRIFQCSEQDISATRKDFSKIPKDSERPWSETSISGTFSARNNPCTFSPRFQITVSSPIDQAYNFTWV